MAIFEHIINHKINHISATELMNYGNQFNIQISKPQAVKIADYLQGKEINIFNDTERARLIKEIAKITGPETARAVNKLFMQFMK